MVVLLDLDARLELHHATQHRVRVGQHAIVLGFDRTAERAQRLDAVVQEQELEPVALKLVGGLELLTRMSMSSIAASCRRSSSVCSS